MTRIFKASMPVMLVIFFLVTAATAHAYTYVELLSDRTRFRVGEAFDVQVAARGVTEIDPKLGQDFVLGFAFDVYYPGHGLAFTGAAMGPGFDAVPMPGNQVSGIAPPWNAGDLFGEKILLASLSFECLSAGKFLLGIASDRDDPFGGLFTRLHHENIFAGLEVNVAPVPAPPSLLLLATGLIGLVYCRRRTRWES
jgi:hypothetical protein